MAKVRTAEIKTGRRFRGEPKNTDALAVSIQRVGPRTLR